jgi:hypothetical protein
MDYKRIHVRVPISGEALLSNGKEVRISAEAIDISRGGVAITAPAKPLTEKNYDITIRTKDGRKIIIGAKLVREMDDVLGFKTCQIDGNSLKIITDLVLQYQETPEFIKQIEEHNLFGYGFIDDEGNELEVTFDVGKDKSEKL